MSRKQRDIVPFTSVKLTLAHLLALTTIALTALLVNLMLHLPTSRHRALNLTMTAENFSIQLKRCLISLILINQRYIASTVFASGYFSLGNMDTTRL